MKIHWKPLSAFFSWNPFFSCSSCAVVPGKWLGKSRWPLVLTWLSPASPSCPFLLCPERGACLPMAVPPFPFFGTVVSSISSRPARYKQFRLSPLQSCESGTSLCLPNCSLLIFQTQWFSESWLLLVTVLCLYQIILPELWWNYVCP